MNEMNLPSTQDSKFVPRVLSGRARYLVVTEAPHNTEFYECMEKKHFCFFQTAETEKRNGHNEPLDYGKHFSHALMHTL